MAGVAQVTEPHFGWTRLGHPVHTSTVDHLPSGNMVDRFNSRLAIWTTKVVGTMWCAYAFAIFDCLALPTALRAGMYGIVQWVASFFLQLVLLSVIMVGQNLQATSSDSRAAKTFEDTEMILDKLNLETEGGIKVLNEKLDQLLAMKGKTG